MFCEPFEPAPPWRFMKTITCFFLFLALAVSFGIWKISCNTYLANSRIETVEKETGRITQELKGLDKYKDARGSSLEEFYPEVFSGIKEICSYYRADSEIKIIGAKDFVNTGEFFKESRYKGVRCVDILAQIGFRGHPDMYLMTVFYKMTKNMPIEIVGLSLEKDTLRLTLRLYGI